MEIVITEKKVSVDDGSSITIDHLGNCSYTKTSNPDILLLTFSSAKEKKLLVSKTRVNGVQMTPDNIDELLSPLFSTTGSSGGSSTNPQSDAYTKSEYSDPLIFPTPLRSGHVVEFYKDQQLYQSYQWTGFFWDLVGMKPNLAYVLANQNNIVNASNDSSVLAAFVTDGKQYVAVKKDTVFSARIDTTQLLTVDKTYTIGQLSYHLTQDQHLCVFENASVNYFDFTEKQLIANTTYACELLIKECELYSFNVSVAVDKLQLVDCQPLPDQQEINFLNLSAADVELERTKVNVVVIYLTEPSQNNYPVSVKVHDTVFNEGLTINNRYTGVQLNYDISVSITGNTGIKHLMISEIVYLGTITSLELDLDPDSLLTVNISDTAFAPDAQQVLIDALTSKNYTQLDRSFYAYGVSLTLEQMTALENAGWQVSS